MLKPFVVEQQNCSPIEEEKNRYDLIKFAADPHSGNG